MEANQAFNKILHEIEHSKLNYIITRRTPFSASVSLKSSFINFFCEEENSKSKSETQETASGCVKSLEIETSEQKAKIDELERIIEQQKVMIIEERVKWKNRDEFKKENDLNAEIQIANLREELLKVKKEKHNLNANLKVQTDEIEVLKKETVVVKRENEKLEKKVQKTMNDLEAKTKEVNVQKKANDEIKALLDESKLDLSKLKLEKQTEDQPFYECSDCDSRLHSYKSLKQHMRSEHCKNKATQNDTISIFEEYPCYYCDTIIFSTSDLEQHVSTCQGGFRMIEDYEFPCDFCDTDCGSKVELEQHITAYHYTFYTDEDLKSCDFCGRKFGTLGGLRSHIRSLHKEMLPA